MIPPLPESSSGESDAKKLKLYLGESTRQIGEDNELKVFKRFQQILSTGDHAMKDESASHLLLRNFFLEKFKLDAISREYPKAAKQIDEFYEFCLGRKKKPKCELGETDILVFVEGIGIVVFEVKNSEGKLKDGIAQARRMERFAKLVSDICTRDVQLTIVKAVIICSDNVNTKENESIKSIPDPIQDGSSIWVLQKAALENAKAFCDSWSVILTNLKQLNSDNTLCPSKSQFQEFLYLMAGIWSMVAFPGSINYRGKSSSYCFIILLFLY